MDKLTSELGTAANIRDKNVRKDVITALKSSLFALKNYSSHVAPTNGLVLCAGSIHTAGQKDSRL